MLWRLTQTPSREEDYTLGYFTSKRALLRYCKAQIGTDCPSLPHCPCCIAVIGRIHNADGTCSIDYVGTVAFEGKWVDGNTHRVTRAVPTWKA